MESYEEGNEDERGKMRKVIRKREDSYDEDKDIVRCWGEKGLLGENTEENNEESIKWGLGQKMRKVWTNEESMKKWGRYE